VVVGGKVGGKGAEMETFLGVGEKTKFGETRKKERKRAKIDTLLLPPQSLLRRKTS